MEFTPISEMRSKYLTDKEGNVPERGTMSDYKNWTDAQLKKAAAINTRRMHILESYAKQTGETLDPIWSKYTYEEVIQMEDTGVSIPKAVKNWAHSMQDADTTNYEISDGNENEKNKDGNAKNEGNPFLELVSKAKSNIAGCEDKNQQINESLEKFDPLAKEATSFKDRIEDHKKSALQKIEEVVDEWKNLKSKNDKGETLTKSEQDRYEQLGKVFNKKNSDYKSEMLDNSINFNRLAKTISELSLTTAETSILGSETLDIGTELSDCESKSKFKNTKNAVGQNIGILGAMMLMSSGKRVAQEATKTGTETEKFSNDVQITMNELASIMDITLNPSGTPEQNQKENEQNPTIAKTANTGTVNAENPVIKSSTETDTTKQENNDKDTNKKATENIITNINNISTQQTAGTAVNKSAMSQNGTAQNGIQTNTKTKTNSKTKAEDKTVNSNNGKESAKELKAQEGGARSATRQTEQNTKDSEKIAKEAKHTDKELKNDEKNLKKRLKNEQTILKENEAKINKIAEEIDEDTKAMETLNVEIQTYMAESESKSSSAAPQPAKVNTQQNSRAKSTGDVNSIAQNAPIQQNNFANNNSLGNASASNGKITELQANLTTRSVSIEKNYQQSNKLQNISNKTIRSMKKTNTQYVKAVNKTQKSLNENVKEESKILKIAQKVEGICSPIALIGLAVKIAGYLLMKVVLPPWIPIVGAFMAPIGASAEALGNYGVAAANITKTAVYASQGNLMGALMSAGMATLSGVSALGATKDAVAGFKGLSDTVSAIGTRAAGAKIANEGAKQLAEQGVTKAGINGLKDSAKDLSNNLVNEALKTGSTDAIEGLGQELANSALNSAGGKVAAGTFIKQTANRAIQEMTKSTAQSVGFQLLQSGMGYAQNKFGQEQPQAEEGKKATYTPYKMSQKFRNIKKKNDIQRVAMSNNASKNSNQKRHG